MKDNEALTDDVLSLLQIARILSELVFIKFWFSIIMSIQVCMYLKTDEVRPQLCVKCDHICTILHKQRSRWAISARNHFRTSENEMD